MENLKTLNMPLNYFVTECYETHERNNEILGISFQVQEDGTFLSVASNITLAGK